MVSSINATVGHKVKAGEPWLTIEAIKIYTTISAPIDGTVEDILVVLGESVESKDLLLCLTAADS